MTTFKRRITKIIIEKVTSSQLALLFKKSGHYNFKLRFFYNFDI